MITAIIDLDYNEVATKFYNNSINLNEYYNILLKTTNCTEKVRNLIRFIYDNDNVFYDNKQYKKHWDNFTDLGRTKRTDFVNNLKNSIEQVKYHSEKLKQIEAKEESINDVKNELIDTKKELAKYKNLYANVNNVLKNKEKLIIEYKEKYDNLKITFTTNNKECENLRKLNNILVKNIADKEEMYNLLKEKINNTNK